MRPSPLLADGMGSVDVLFIVLPDTLLLDLAGPAEAFRLANQNLARQGHAPLFRLRHAGPLAQTGSSVGLQLCGIEPLPAALTLHKHRHSALVGTGLSIWLHQQGIRRLIVAGIRTEQCCETTTRHASDEGWEVDYVLDATLTFDMRTPDGALLSAAAIKERTATVLAGRFATICSVAQALDRAAAAPVKAIA